MNYAALQAAWGSATQPPANVTGTALTSGMTTAQKIAAVNGWTVSAPQRAILTPSQILNAILPADLESLTTAQVSLLTLVLQGSTVDGSAGTTVRTVVLAIFSGKTTTLASLAALVAPFDNAMQSWCAANGYPFIGNVGNLSTSDAQNAGLV